MIKPELIEAYSKTHYFIEGVKVPIKIGELFDFENLPKLQDNTSPIESIAFITAYNPYSEILTDEENYVLNKKLEDSAVELEYIYFRGIGLNPSGKWKGEKSIAIVNISKDSASKISKMYKQNAFVYLKRNEIAQLVITA